jgi:hypothetical protein
MHRNSSHKHTANNAGEWYYLRKTAERGARVALQIDLENKSPVMSFRFPIAASKIAMYSGADDAAHFAMLTCDPRCKTVNLSDAYKWIYSICRPRGIDFADFGPR